MTKKLVHSFYHILYQPKGVPTSRDNFSGTGGTGFTELLNNFGRSDDQTKQTNQSFRISGNQEMVLCPQTVQVMALSASPN